MLPVILAGLLILACGGDSKGPPPEATAVPAGTAIAVTATALPVSPTPPPVGSFTKTGTAKLPNLQGLVFQKGGNGLLAYSRNDVQIIDTQGAAKSLLTVAEPEAIASVSETGFVAVKGAGNSVRVQNVRTKDAPKQVNPGLAVEGVTLSSDGSLLAMTEVDKIAAVIWDVEENSRLKELTGFQTAAPVYSVGFGPGGRTVVWLSRARIQMQDIASGALSQTFSHEDFVTAYALSPDRQTLITASGDKVTIWDVASTKVRSVLTEKGVVSDVALPADNHTLAIAGPQGVRLVDITNGKEITSLPGLAREVTFSEDGKQLATADDQGNVTLYRAG